MDHLAHRNSSFTDGFVPGRGASPPVWQWLAGVLAQSIGWPAFFLVSIVAAVPALALLAVLRRPIDLLERSPEEADAAP